MPAQGLPRGKIDRHMGNGNEAYPAHSRLLTEEPRKCGSLVEELSMAPAARNAKASRGGMGERLKPAVLKTVSLERGSGVRIPLPPPS